MLSGGMFLGWIFLLLFLVLIGGVIGGGEITREEFHSMREDLMV